MKYGQDRLFAELQAKTFTEDERMKLIAETSREEDIKRAATRALQTKLWTYGFLIVAALVIVGGNLGWFPVN